MLVQILYIIFERFDPQSVIVQSGPILTQGLINGRVLLCHIISQIIQLVDSLRVESVVVGLHLRHILPTNFDFVA